MVAVHPDHLWQIVTAIRDFRRTHRRGPTHYELTARLGVTPQALTYRARKLRAMGYVTWRPPRGRPPKRAVRGRPYYHYHVCLSDGRVL